MAARTGMTNAITELRAKGQAGTAEYTLGSDTYFTDEHLQDILDRNRVEFYDLPLEIEARTDTSGNARYYDYYFPGGDWEEATGGTPVWLVQDSTGEHVGTASYTVNYAAGHIRFSADQAGTVYYLTGRKYNMNRAAAAVWYQKAANVANRFDWSSDNHRMSASQLHKHYMAMAVSFERAEGGRVQRMMRSDVNA